MSQSTDFSPEQSLEATSHLAGGHPTPSLPTPTPLNLPSIVGDYELLEELGRGGMGVVIKARQKGLGRLVALKMVLADISNPTVLERFRQEARSAAALDHPGIVPIFDFGELNGQPYFTMAFVEGDSLSGMLRKKGPMPPQQAVRFVVQIADAVAYAHERGILHRDLKPDNVLVDRQGYARVTDFGLARRLNNDANLTNTGSVLGTPAFMAPEQAQGHRDLTPAADVYSLGAMLHTLLCGKPPFTGGGILQVLLQVAQDAAPRLRQINPALPEVLERICLHCLEKNPSQRYNSADELATDLRGWLGDSVSSTPSLPKPHLASGDGLSHSLTPASVPHTPSVAVPVPAPARWHADVSRPSFLTPWRWWIAAVLLAVAGVSYGVWFFPRKATSPSAAVPRDVQPVDPDPETWPKADRHDFALTVSLLGSNPGVKGVYRIDSSRPFRLAVESAEDAYLGVWSIQADGSVVQLFPNQFDVNHLVRSGVTRIIPGNKEYLIQPDPSQKVEFIRVLASSTPWEPAKGEKEGPFVVFRNASLQRWEAHYRGLKVVPKGASIVPAAGQQRVTEAVLPYFVEAPR